MIKVRKSPLSPRKSLIVTRENFSTIDRNDTPGEQLSEPPPYTKRNVVKNLFVLNLGVFLYLMAFLSLSNLQSSVNSYQGLGTASQAAIYASATVSCLLLPQLAIRSLGCKGTIALGLSCCALYTAANYYPTWSTMIPTAVLQGSATGAQMVTYATYVHEMALRYGRLVRAGDHEAIEAIFFGMYSFMAANTEIWGNLVSFLVLRPSEPLNSTAVGWNCGVEFGSAPNRTRPSTILEPMERKYNLLVTTFLAINALSVLTIVLFLDPLRNDIDGGQTEGGRCRALLDRLTAAAKQALIVDQCLLVPLSAYCGLEMGFYISRFTQAFIACSWGVYHVGLVSIGYGVSGTLTSVLVGPLVKWTSQTSVIVLAALINITTCGLLFLWKPSPLVPTLFFVFAVLLGVTDAIWWSQIPALHGILFSSNREAAFSNFFFWANFGLFVNFSTASYLTVSASIIVLLTVLIVGMVLFIALRVKVGTAPRAGYVPLH